MARTPADLEEWANDLRVASDAALAEFGSEVLDLIDRDFMVDLYLQGIDLLIGASSLELSPTCPEDEKMWRLIESLSDAVEAADEANGERLDRRREMAEKINVAEMYVAEPPKPTLEYDL